jgi:hypothetical protein
MMCRSCGAGVGGVLEHQVQVLGEFGFPVTAGSWRSASHSADCMTRRGVSNCPATEGRVMAEVDEQGADGPPAKCHVCGSEFSSEKELSKHLMDIHDEDLLPDPRDGA